MNMLLESILMGTGITVWTLIILSLLVFVVFKSVDWIGNALEAMGRADLAIRFLVWANSLWEHPSESYLNAAEKVAEWNDVKDEVKPYINSYRPESYK